MRIASCTSPLTRHPGAWEIWTLQITWPPAIAPESNLNTLHLMKPFCLISLTDGSFFFFQGSTAVQSPRVEVLFLLLVTIATLVPLLSYRSSRSVKSLFWSPSLLKDGCSAESDGSSPDFRGFINLLGCFWSWWRPVIRPVLNRLWFCSTGPQDMCSQKKREAALHNSWDSISRC